mmetsp:Transcript_43024/g.135603  ORF Transcript_43024/g.135603 Transcript_43024/m.135603 type:complete len:247 (+) Transcript_43024:2-742(+)
MAHLAFPAALFATRRPSRHGVVVTTAGIAAAVGAAVALQSAALWPALAAPRGGAFAGVALGSRRAAVGSAGAAAAAAAAGAGSPEAASAAAAAASSGGYSNPKGLGPLEDAVGRQVGVTALTGKSVALYFAGAWCPMCQAFTPKLKEFMGKHPEKAVVFVSSDFSEDAFATHRAALGADWLSVPFGSEALFRLKAQHRAWGMREASVFGGDRRSGLPTLVVVDPVTGDELKLLDAESKGPRVLGEW